MLIVTDKSTEKDAHYSETSATWIQMPSLQGCIYGDFSIGGILSFLSFYLSIYFSSHYNVI